jgi:hypothetical protein
VKYFKIILIVFVASIISLILYLSISLYLDVPCGNTIQNTVYSPSHTKKAVVFERDCGATTQYSTQVAIIESEKDLPNISGNVLASADVLHFQPEYLYWQNEDTLVIKYNYTADIRFKKDFVDGVKIRYENTVPVDTGNKNK